MARTISQGVSGALGQPVIVENRNNLIGEIVAKSPPDGYTLIFGSGSLWTLPLLQTVPYDPVRAIRLRGSRMHRALAHSQNGRVIHFVPPVFSGKTS